MKFSTPDSFKITLAIDIDFLGTPIRVDDIITSYVISIGDKLHGSVYPDHGQEGERPLVWRSKDNMDKYLVNLIGKMIESHYE